MPPTALKMTSRNLFRIAKKTKTPFEQLYHTYTRAIEDGHFYYCVLDMPTDKGPTRILSWVWLQDEDFWNTWMFVKRESKSRFNEITLK